MEKKRLAWKKMYFANIRLAFKHKGKYIFAVIPITLRRTCVWN